MYTYIYIYICFFFVLMYVCFVTCCYILVMYLSSVLRISLYFQGNLVGMNPACTSVSCLEYGVEVGSFFMHGVVGQAPDPAVCLNCKYTAAGNLPYGTWGSQKVDFNLRGVFLQNWICMFMNNKC